MKTEVCISVDVEFSIGGAFARPDEFKPIGLPAVQCMVNGVDEGLGFLLRSLGEYHVSATFFIEALQALHFGDDPMKEIVDKIRRCEQDVQLHIHPCWLYFEHPDGSSAPNLKNDSCAGRSDAELDGMFAKALATFSRWGLLRPVAFRTGNLNTDLAVYRALARAKIPISSSIGVAICPPVEDELTLLSGRHWIEGVLELPVFSYRDLQIGTWRHHRPLSINACSSSEIEFVLWDARRLGISPVVLITHPADFIKTKDFRFSELRRNRVTQMRFLKLLKFLREHDNDFVSVSIAERNEAWLSSNETHNLEILMPFARFRDRLIENGINRCVWRF